MALTPFRWIAALISACLIVAVALIREDPPLRREAGVERQLIARADYTGGLASNAGARLRHAQVWDSLRAVLAQPTPQHIGRLACRDSVNNPEATSSLNNTERDIIM